MKVSMLTVDSTRSLEDKRRILCDAIWYEIVFTFGVPRHDPNDYCQWEAINFTRMGHARVLYTFLETATNKRLKDDVLAEDYGFMAIMVDLPAEDRMRLNKDLFHLTYSRLRHTSLSKKWPDSILQKLFPHVIDFMEHVSKKDDYFLSSEHITYWHNLLTSLKSGRELLIQSTTDSSGTRYRFDLGEELPQKLPRLTK